MQRPTTLHEDVYKRIKSMIALRELAPGTQLVFRNLARQLGTSTMPVVEAIRRLEHDGLVTQIPKWGAYVKEWTEQERLEAFHIRRALEGEAARLFVLRAPPEKKKELASLNEQFDRATQHDLVAGLDADVALHLHIARSTGFPRLAQLIEVSKMPLTIFWKFFRQPDIEKLKLLQVGCHARLVNVLLGNDPALAAQAMWDHVDGTVSLLNGQLSCSDEGLVAVAGRPARQAAELISR